jgi:AbiTii-like protein
VLAARTGARDLEAWVRAERDGYKDDDVVPTYRGPIHTAVIGQFSGPFGSVISNLPIPRWPFMDNPLLEHAFQIELRQPMTVLET